MAMCTSGLVGVRDRARVKGLFCVNGLVCSGAACYDEVIRAAGYASHSAQYDLTSELIVRRDTPWKQTQDLASTGEPGPAVIVRRLHRPCSTIELIPTITELIGLPVSVCSLHRASASFCHHKLHPIGGARG